MTELGQRTTELAIAIDQAGAECLPPALAIGKKRREERDNFRLDQPNECMIGCAEAKFDWAEDYLASLRRAN